MVTPFNDKHEFDLDEEFDYFQDFSPSNGLRDQVVELLDARDAECLRELLAAEPSPVSLEIDEYHEAITLLAEALASNTTVTSLSLMNQQQDESAREEARDQDGNLMRRIAEMLQRNSTLTKLLLPSNEVTDKSACPLAEVLKSNSTLKTLSLSNNDIKNEGAMQLAGMLRVNSTLTSLDLFCNYVKNKGAMQLADVLTVNSTLRFLSVAYSVIKPAGISAFAAALKINSTLRTLHLHKNLPDDESMDQVLAALQNNGSLTQLTLSTYQPESHPCLERNEYNVLAKEQTLFSMLLSIHHQILRDIDFED